MNKLAIFSGLALLGAVSLASVKMDSVEAQENSRVKIWWDITAPPGALYLNICSDPRINYNPRTGGCGKIDVLNENVSKNKDQLRFVDDRLEAGKEYRACLVADQTSNRSGRWMVCREFTAQDGGEVSLNAVRLAPIRPNP